MDWPRSYFSICCLLWSCDLHNCCHPDWLCTTRLRSGVVCSCSIFSQSEDSFCSPMPVVEYFSLERKGPWWAKTPRRDVHIWSVDLLLGSPYSYRVLFPVECFKSLQAKGFMVIKAGQQGAPCRQNWSAAFSCLQINEPIITHKEPWHN